MAGGRPRKPADPWYPRRAANREAVDENTTEPVVNAGNATNDIGVFSEGTRTEVDGREQTASYTDDEAKPIEQTYICDACETTLLEGMPECPGCQRKLSWNKVFRSV